MLAWEVLHLSLFPGWSSLSLMPLRTRHSLALGGSWRPLSPFKISTPRLLYDACAWYPRHSEPSFSTGSSLGEARVSKRCKSTLYSRLKAQTASTRGPFSPRSPPFLSLHLPTAHLRLWMAKSSASAGCRELRPIDRWLPARTFKVSSCLCLSARNTLWRERLLETTRVVSSTSPAICSSLAPLASSCLGRRAEQAARFPTGDSIKLQSSPSSLSRRGSLNLCGRKAGRERR